jgi:hypothetical protein
VLELFVSLGKLDTLIHNLLVIEAWKEAVYPLVSHHIATTVDPILSYTLLFHEALLANLLEVSGLGACHPLAVMVLRQAAASLTVLASQVTLFHEHACQAIDEDHLLELCDWGYRKLQYLNSQAYDHVAVRGACSSRHTAPVAACTDAHALLRAHRCQHDGLQCVG